MQAAMCFLLVHIVSGCAAKGEPAVVCRQAVQLDVSRSSMLVTPPEVQGLSRTSQARRRLLTHSDCLTQPSRTTGSLSLLTPAPCPAGLRGAALPGLRAHGALLRAAPGPDGPGRRVCHRQSARPTPGGDSNSASWYTFISTWLFVIGFCAIWCARPAEASTQSAFFNPHCWSWPSCDSFVYPSLVPLGLQISFKETLDQYRKMPQARSHIYRRVPLLQDAGVQLSYIRQRNPCSRTSPP